MVRICFGFWFAVLSHCYSRLLLANSITWSVNSLYTPPNSTGQQTKLAGKKKSQTVKWSGWGNFAQKKTYSVMFLRSIGSRFSIHQRALLLRRVPVRTVINAQQTVVEENGCDTSLVRGGLCLSLTFALQLPMHKARSAITCILIGEFYFLMGECASREARK